MSRTLVASLLAVALAAADPWTVLTEAVALPPAEQRAALTALVAERPAFLPGHYNLGTLLIGVDTPAAIRHLELAATAEDPAAAADAWHNLALARWAAGQLDEAVAAMVEAARRDPALGPVRDELRRAALARQDEARRAAEAAERVLRLDPTPPPPARFGEPYRHPLVARGGQGPYRFAVVPDEGGAGGLPAGLRLDPDGAIAGVPATVGRWQVAVAVRDAATASAQGTVPLVILPPPRIRTTALDEAVLDHPYAAALVADGLDAPRWRIDGLPEGLSLDPASGRISGIPRRPGSATLAVVAEDGQRRATATLPLTVAETFAPNLSALPTATAWAAYAARVTMRGPAGIYRFTTASSNGLVLAGDGTISGEPAAAGSATLATVIEDARGRRRPVVIPITVMPPPIIDENAPITLKRGSPVARPLGRQGGTGPFAWTVIDGALPKGLRLDPDGTLRGAPAEVGTSTATVEVLDRWKAAARHGITLQVEPADEEPPRKQEQQEEKNEDQQQDGQDGDPSQTADGKDGKDGKDGQGKQGQQGQDPAADASPPGSAGASAAAQAMAAAAASAAAQAEAEADALRAAAAEGFLDSLPAGDADALRALLHGGTVPPARSGQTW